MTIPKASNNGDRLRLKGKGFATGKSGARGDQLVTLRVVLPEKPDAELSDFLTGWADGHGYDPRAGMEI